MEQRPKKLLDQVREVGIFCEPASAASVAGLLKLAGEGRVVKGQTVVCVLTGSGLKDPETAVHLTGYHAIR